MLADAGSPLLLTTESLADELPTQWTVPLLLDADWDVIALNPDEALPELSVRYVEKYLSAIGEVN